MNPGLRIERVQSIDSTNAELLRRDSGPPSHPHGPDPAGSGSVCGERGFPVFLVADRQTAGRGRAGRRWHSAAASSLTASLGIDAGPDQPVATAHLPLVPLAAAVAAIEAIRQLHARAEHSDEHSSATGAMPASPFALKWPNDLVRVDAQHRLVGKVGGILCEARTTGSSLRLVVGVGINLWPDAPVSTGSGSQAVRMAASGADGQPAPLPAATVFGAPQPALREALISSLGPSLLQRVEQCLQQGLGPLRASWDACDALRGRPVQVHQRPLRAGELWRSWSGTAQGIDEAGALRVRRHEDGRTISVSTDEVSVRVS